MITDMDYKKLPNNSKTWVYQADRELSKGEVLKIRSQADDFISTWAAHGADLSASIEVFHNHFIVIMVDEEQAEATGCSIDKSVHFIEQVEGEYGIILLNRLLVAWREGDTIQSCPLDEFERKLQRGDIGEDTIVFDLAENHSQEGRLSGSVCSDQPYTVPFGEGDLNIVKTELDSVLNGQSRPAEQWHGTGNSIRNGSVEGGKSLAFVP